jgi:hypothetical protein
MGAEALDNDGSAAMPLYHAKLSFAVATQHVSVWLRLCGSGFTTFSPVPLQK